MTTRCAWAKSELSARYHDEEWGVPRRDEQGLFEFITLEGAQAGLSWETILRKRERYREVFAGFDPEKIARFTPARIEKLLLDPGIVRNRAKVEATVGNARAYLRMRERGETLESVLWGVVGGEPIVSARKALSEIPAKTAESDAMSKALLSRGYKFVGSTICYALMQACGVVNDHTVDCFRYRELTAKRRK